ncbi:MAG: right-handed parallel beta-helix repeat-containing protein [Roseburia sp.]|nr:right-handed parallel beta-helix repeat-containing protein [Roseburia sp.]
MKLKNVAMAGFSLALALALVPGNSVSAKETGEISAKLASGKTVSVTEYGANGGDTAADDDAINKALEAVRDAGGGTVNVPNGTYYISDYLCIYSDTTLHLDSGAKMVRAKNCATVYDSNTKTEKYQPMVKNYKGEQTVLKGSGYGYTKNVTIEGGSWDGNVGKAGTTSDKLGDIFQIYCATNITIQDTKLSSVCGFHHANLASVDHVVVKNVTFSDFVKYKGTDYKTLETGEDNNNAMNASASLTSEALQFDNFSGANISKNIEVTGCTFQDVLSGVGNHHDKAEGDVTKTGAQSVKITGNTFKNVENTCVNLYNFTDVSVSDNTASSVRTFVRVYKGNQCTVDKNTISNHTGKNKYNMFRVSDGAVLTISNNTVNGAGNIAVKLDTKSKADILNNTFTGTMKSAVFIDKSSGTVTGNSVPKTTDAGISIANATAAVTVDQNTIVDSKTNGIYVLKSAVTVNGNELKNTGDHAIYIKGGSGKVTNNTVSKTKKGSGIYLVEKSKVSEISGNTVTNPKECGVYIKDTSSTVSVSKNTVKNSGSSGIFAVKSKFKIDGNTVNNTGSHAIYIKGGSGKITNNIVNKTKKGSGIYVVEKANVSEINGNKVTSPKENGVYVNGATATVGEQNDVKKQGGKTVTMKDAKFYAISGSVKLFIDGKNATVQGASSKNLDTIVIPDKIKVGKNSYSVTKIADKAFQKNKKIVNVTIGKNVSQIGKSAFENCTSLKELTIKTTKLTNAKVGKNAFKKIAADCTVKVPKGKAALYKKILTSKGAGKKIKVK